MSERHNSYSTVGSRKRASARYSMLLHRIHNTHKPRNKGYKGVEVRLTREEFIKWFMPLDFEGCSVDRIDVKGHYELSNMQVIPLVENMRKDRMKAVGGECVCYSCNKAKPLEEFAKDKRRITGRSTCCRDCDNACKRSTGA